MGAEQKVAIITGASQGIGEVLVPIAAIAMNRAARIATSGNAIPNILPQRR